MLVRYLVIAALVYLVWRWLSKLGVTGSPKPAHPPTGTSKASPHDVLGVQPDASHEEIRKAYQKRIHQYHPDKIAAMAPELRALAEKRTKEINAAYEQLKRGAS